MFNPSFPARPLEPVSLEDPCGAAALLAGWDRLEGSARLPTQDARFVLALTGTMLAGAETVLFLAGAPGRPQAMLPLSRSRGFLARWRLPGAREVYEPGDALGRGDSGIAALADALAAQGRPLVLDRLPANSPLIPALGRAMAGRGWLRLRSAVACPRIALSQSWTEPESRFNARRRSDFRRAARRAADLGKVDYELHRPGTDEFPPLFEEALEVELQGWKREAGTAIASDPAKRAFFETYLGSAAEAGMLRIGFMRIDGKAVAMQLAVEWANRYWLYKIGYDETFRRCSPGNLLMLHAIGEAAQQGLEGFELLGDAEAWILELWTSEQIACTSLKTYPYNLRGAAAFLADGLAWIGRRLDLAGR